MKTQKIEALALPEDVMKLHREAVVVDAHHDITFDVWQRRIRGEKGVLASWGPELRRGGVNVQVFPTWVPTNYLPEMALRVMLNQIGALYADTEEDPSVVHWVRTYDDIETALAAGKVAGIISFEGCEALGRDVGLIPLFYRLGVRMISFTWNRRTTFADGIAETGTGGGVTTLGLKALQEINRLGIVMDVAHISEAGYWDVLNNTTQPVIVSHANCRAVCDSPRNLNDEQIKALAKNGGVMGIMLIPRFVDPDEPTVARVVDHIIHVADLIGVEHIGLGSDLVEESLQGMTSAELASERLFPTHAEDQLVIEGCRYVHEFPNLTAEMIRRGFSKEDTKAVLGGNFLRIFREILHNAL